MKKIPKTGKHINVRKQSQAKIRAIRNTKLIMSNHTITLVMANKDNECSTVYYKNRLAKVSPQLAWHFENTRCHWNIICGVICRDQQGKHYIEYVSFGSVHECTIDTLSELAFEACKKLFDQAIKMHKLCPFYMARPHQDIDPLLILNTIKSYKVLNLIGTNFEFDCNLPFVDYHTPENWAEVLRTIEFKQLDLEFTDEN